MNAKFEKWYCQSPGAETPKQLAIEAWKAAIHSIEVTPELRNLAIDAYESAPGVMQDTAMQYALIAVFSALKEQAK